MEARDLIAASAKIFKILGDESKLSILYLLSQEEANVSTLVEKLGFEQSNVSHHLRTLRDHRLVRSRREGKSVIYFPDDHHVYQIIDQVFDHVKEDGDIL